MSGVSGSETVLYEHPGYGTARVLFAWKPRMLGWQWTPVAVEFDIFTPDSEKEELLRLLTEHAEGARLDSVVKRERLEGEGEDPF